MKIDSKKTLIISGLLFLTSAFIIFLSISEFDPKSKDLINPSDTGPKTIFQQEKETLIQDFKKHPPEKIYKTLLEKYADSPATTQHGIAHVFGELLFDKAGSEGITVCDNSFAFGCFHGYFSKAIPAEGIEIIKDLDQMCIKKFGEYSLGCQHGLGHGVAEYYGPQNLEKSLEACTSLSWKHKLMGCSGGVFMEYLTPTQAAMPGSVYVKPLNTNNPYHPCPQVKEFFQPECYYNLGIYYFHSTNSDIKKSLAYCTGILNITNKESCLMGLGNSVYSLNRDISATIQLCASTSDAASEAYCRGGAAWILYTNQNTRDQASELCRDLSQEESVKCLQASNLLEIALNL